MATKLMACKCTNAYQDSLYGKQVRVHNKMKPPSGKGQPQEWRCATCTAVHFAAQEALPELSGAGA